MEFAGVDMYENSSLFSYLVGNIIVFYNCDMRMKLFPSPQKAAKLVHSGMRGTEVDALSPTSRLFRVASTSTCPHTAKSVHQACAGYLWGGSAIILDFSLSFVLN